MIGTQRRARRQAARQARAAAEALYDRIVAQARQADFYERLEVPDSVDGRFEMLALHMFLVLRCLKGPSDEAQAVAQALFDRMFADMDRGLRDLGVGDMKVGKHVRRMAEALYGRISVYEAGLGKTDILADAVRRNLYGTVTPSPLCVAALCTYIESEAAAQAAKPPAAFIGGDVVFGAVP